MRTLPIHAACQSGNRAALKKIVCTVSRQVLEVRDSLGRTPLILCAIHNRCECAEVLLKAGAHVDNSDNAGQTALHVAASKGFHGLAKLLLAHRASWMQGDYFGVTSLHLAAVHSSVKCLAAVLKCLRPGETDVQDGSQKTPLHWSAAYARHEHIRLLLAQGANICIPDEDGRTPLHWAASSPEPEALECVQTLLRGEENLVNWQDYQGRSALHAAVASGSSEVLYFLAAREDCNIDVLDNSFCTPLHWAAKRGLAEKADILLRRRANHSSADDHGATPLHYAAHNDFAQTAEVFMSRHHPFDEVDKLGRTVVVWAAIRDSKDALKVIATNNSALLLTPDKTGSTALHAAAIQGHTSLVEALLDLGVPIDVADRSGMTPFLRACEAGRSRTAQQLLDRGADISARDVHQSSALHWCAKGGHAYLSQILVRGGADCNVQDSLGATPLHCASLAGDHVNCVSVLLESDADPGVTDFEGKTPLHWAVLCRRKGVARLLCEHGSDANAMFAMHDWVSPLDCALLKNDLEVARMLRGHGGITAGDVKESAARLLQSWVRRVLGKRRNAATNPEVTIDASCDAGTLEREDECADPRSVPEDLRNALVQYHECNGCYHRIRCRHVCARRTATSVQHAAACTIQRTFRRLVMRRRFGRVRSEVANAFQSAEVRRSAEEAWQLQLKEFYEKMWSLK